MSDVTQPDVIILNMEDMEKVSWEAMKDRSRDAPLPEVPFSSSI